MSSTIILLAAAYVTVAAFLAVVLLSSTTAFSIRAVATLLTVALFYGTYVAVGELRGWPSDEPLPESFRLLWGRVVEPDPLLGDTGRVYLWIEELDEDNYSTRMPRAHSLPYSAELAALVEGAVQELRAGTRIGGSVEQNLTANETFERLTEEARIAAEGPANADMLGERYTPFDFGSVRFAPLPAPVTPEKDG